MKTVLALLSILGVLGIPLTVFYLRMFLFTLNAKNAQLHTVHPALQYIQGWCTPFDVCIGLIVTIAIIAGPYTAYCLAGIGAIFALSLIGYSLFWTFNPGTWELISRAHSKNYQIWTLLLIPGILIHEIFFNCLAAFIIVVGDSHYSAVSFRVSYYKQYWYQIMIGLARGKPIKIITIPRNYIKYFTNTYTHKTDWYNASDILERCEWWAKSTGVDANMQHDWIEVRDVLKEYYIDFGYQDYHLVVKTDGGVSW